MRRELFAAGLLYAGISFVLSGCSGKSASLTPKGNGAGAPTVEVVRGEGDEKFKNALLESVKNVEKHYVDYIRLLEKLKSKRTLPKDKIPLGMGKRISVAFDGYLLDLIRKVVAEAGYDLKLVNLRVQDSPVVSRNYIDTRIIDILEDSLSYAGYDAEIDEKNKIVTVAKE